MAFVMRDRVRETSTATGTGDMTGLTTVPGYQSFAFVTGADTVPYAIVCADTSEWEVGIGTYAAGALTRVAILSSSNSNLRVTFGAGTKDVFCTLPSVLAMTTNGGIFTGAIQVPSGASGALAPQAQEIGALAVAQRADLYRRGNILGTVTQSAGVPTGALIQSVVTDNGVLRRSTSRFASGLQIFHGETVAAQNVTTAAGAIYIAGPFSMAYNPNPLLYDVDFAAPPTVVGSALDSAVIPCWCGMGSSTNTQAQNLYMFCSGNTASARLGVLAIGRWF